MPTETATRVPPKILRHMVRRTSPAIPDVTIPHVPFVVASPMVVMEQPIHVPVVQTPIVPEPVVDVVAPMPVVAEIPVTVVETPPVAKLPEPVAVVVPEAAPVVAEEPPTLKETPTPAPVTSRVAARPVPLRTAAKGTGQYPRPIPLAAALAASGIKVKPVAALKPLPKKPVALVQPPVEVVEAAEPVVTETVEPVTVVEAVEKTPDPVPETVVDASPELDPADISASDVMLASEPVVAVDVPAQNDESVTTVAEEIPVTPAPIEPSAELPSGPDAQSVEKPVDASMEDFPADVAMTSPVNEVADPVETQESFASEVVAPMSDEISADEPAQISVAEPVAEEVASIERHGILPRRTKAKGLAKLKEGEGEKIRDVDQARIQRIRAAQGVSTGDKPAAVPVAAIAVSVEHKTEPVPAKPVPVRKAPVVAQAPQHEDDDLASLAGVQALLEKEKRKMRGRVTFLSVIFLILLISVAGGSFYAITEKVGKSQASVEKLTQRLDAATRETASSQEQARAARELSETLVKKIDRVTTEMQKLASAPKKKTATNSESEMLALKSLMESLANDVTGVKNDLSRIKDTPAVSEKPKTATKPQASQQKPPAQSALPRQRTIARVMLTRVDSTAEVPWMVAIP